MNSHHYQHDYCVRRESRERLRQVGLKDINPDFLINALSGTDETTIDKVSNLFLGCLVQKHPQSNSKGYVGCSKELEANVTKEVDKRCLIKRKQL